MRQASLLKTCGMFIIFFQIFFMFIIFISLDSWIEELILSNLFISIFNKNNSFVWNFQNMYFLHSGIYWETINDKFSNLKLNLADIPFEPNNIHYITNASTEYFNMTFFFHFLPCTFPKIYAVLPTEWIIVII